MPLILESFNSRDQAPTSSAALLEMPFQEVMFLSSRLGSTVL